MRDDLRRMFESNQVRMLVASAACGADLLALDVARQMGIQYTIVLPFDPERFRRTSVTDRPGDWAELYDHVLKDARARDALHVGGTGGDEHAAYLTAARTILDVAAAAGGEVRAVAVWDGVSRGAGDVTAAFVDMARGRNLAMLEVLTTPRR